MNEDECVCPRLCVGTKRTEARNLSLDCPVHAVEAADAIERLFKEKA